jgi:hypothetical protein
VKVSVRGWTSSRVCLASASSLTDECVSRHPRGLIPTKYLFKECQFYDKNIEGTEGSGSLILVSDKIKYVDNHIYCQTETTLINRNKKRKYASTLNGRGQGVLTPFKYQLVLNAVSIYERPLRPGAKGRDRNIPVTYACVIASYFRRNISSGFELQKGDISLLSLR